MAFWLGRISGKPKLEQQNKSELEKKITAREAELARVKKQLKEEIGSIKKQELEQKVRDLEQQLAKLKKNLPLEKSNKPEQSNPNNKIEIEVNFFGEGYDTNGEISYHFSYANATSTEEFKLFSVSKNHPQIKELLSQGKLQEQEIGKKFIIRYGKVDSQKGKVYIFGKFNTELEIIEA